MGEIGRIDQALAAAGTAPGLVVPFAPLATHELPADEPPLASDSLLTVATLTFYRAQVAVRLTTCVEMLVGQSDRREAFVGQRLEAAHKVSVWAPLLHHIGAEELAAEAAERREREEAQADAPEGPTAPPPPVTYRQLGETLLRRLADAGDQVAVKLPPRFRRVADAMVARLRPEVPTASSDTPPPSPLERAPKV